MVGGPPGKRFANVLGHDITSPVSAFGRSRPAAKGFPAHILIAIDRLKCDTRSAIRCPCTTSVHTDKRYVIGRWGEWGNSEPLKKSK